MSGLVQEADVRRANRHVRLGLEPDITLTARDTDLAGSSSTIQHRRQG